MRAFALFLIAAYRGIFFFLPPRCKYIPSCSLYAQEAFTRYGFLRALGLTLWRLLRCNPWSRGGYDPVK